MKGKLMEVHILKNYGPSNLNRDLVGSPKSVVFGEYMRARISSQCLKRNLRFSDFFAANIDNELRDIRTRRLDKLVVDKLCEFDKKYEEYSKDIDKCLKSLGKKEKEEKEEKGDGKKKESESLGLKTIQFYSVKDVVRIAELIKEQIDNGENIVKYKIEDVLQKEGIRSIGIDIALFGRMAATNSFTTIESPLQVSHAIGTHKMTIENDFFVAVDDVVEKLRNQNGSAHLNDFEFTANCFYEYFNFDYDSFIKTLLKYSDNFKDNESKILEFMPKLVESFIESLIYLTPTGKQTGFASYPTPSFVAIEIKDRKIPLTYHNAYINPVSMSTNVIQNSIDTLIKYINKTDKLFSIDKTRFYLSDMYRTESLENGVLCENDKELVKKVVEYLDF